jgi:hypothetical protein
MLHELIYDKLKLINSKSFPGVAPEGTTLPYIVFFPVSNVPHPNSDGVSKFDFITYQVSCFALSFRDAQVMATDVRLSLDDYTDESDDYRIQRTTFEGSNYIPEGDRVHHMSLDFRFSLGAVND